MSRGRKDYAARRAAPMTPREREQALGLLPKRSGARRAEFMPVGMSLDERARLLSKARNTGDYSILEGL